MEYTRLITSQYTTVTVGNDFQVAGGSDVDSARVDTFIQLRNPEEADILLIVPESGNNGAQVLTAEGYHKIDTEPPVDYNSLVPEAREIIKAKMEAIAKEAEELANLEMRFHQSQAIHLAAGDQEIRFWQDIKCERVDPGTFPNRWRITFQAPFSNFSTDGSTNVSVVIVLPFNAHHVESFVLDPVTNQPVGGYSPFPAQNVAGRQVLGFQLSHDPKFQVVYEYLS